MIANHGPSACKFFYENVGGNCGVGHVGGGDSWQSPQGGVDFIKLKRGTLEGFSRFGC